jgi:hypothetical protein
MRIRSYAFGDENDLQRLKTFVTSTISKEMKRSYWHVGDLVWGIYQNTIFDPRENVRLWENDQGSLLGFTWSNFHEIMLQVSPRLDSVEAQELLEQMLTWGKERQEALSTNENAPSFYAIDDDRQLKKTPCRMLCRRREISSRTCPGMTKQAIQEARAADPSETRSEIAIVIHKKNGKRTCSRLSSLRMLVDCSSLSRSGLSL